MRGASVEEEEAGVGEAEVVGVAEVEIGEEAEEEEEGEEEEDLETGEDLEIGGETEIATGEGKVRMTEAGIETEELGREGSSQRGDQGADPQ